MLDENYQQNTGPAKFLKYCSYVQRGWVGAGTVKTKMEQERSLTKKNCCLAMFFFWVKQRTCCSLQHNIHT